LIWSIALAITLAGMVGMVYMKSKTDELKKDFELTVNCPELVTKEQAYVDQMKEITSGLMGCFCLNLLKTDPIKVYPMSNNVIRFSEFDNFVDDQTPYCFDWFSNYYK
jgi:hypothetical protein